MKASWLLKWWQRNIPFPWSLACWYKCKSANITPYQIILPEKRSVLLSNTTFKWIFCKQPNINLHWLGKSSHHFLYSTYYQTKSGSCHNTLQLQTFCLYTCTKGLQTYLDIYLHPLGSMTTFITNLLYIRKELFETVVAYTFTLMQIFKVEHLTARNKHATYTWSTSPIVIEPPNFSYCHGGTTTNFSLWHEG